MNFTKQNKLIKKILKKNISDNEASSWVYQVNKTYLELKFGKPFADKVELIIDRDVPEGQTYLVNSKALNEYVRKLLNETN